MLLLIGTSTGASCADMSLPPTTTDGYTVSGAAGNVSSPSRR
jgi:hypothetical protein